MMKRSLLYPLFLAAATVMAAGCLTEEEEWQAARPQGDQITIVASLEQPVITKTTLSSERKVLWSVGDKIKVYNASNPNGEVYTLSGGEGSTRGEFSGTALSGSGPFYAVYPADVAGSLSGTSVSVTLPDRQSYAEGGFGSGAAVSMAKGDAINNLVFKNVLGGFSFTLSGSKTISRVRLQTKGSEALNGTGKVSMSTDTPSLTMDARKNDDGSFLYLDGPGSASGSFCIMLPPGAFDKGFLVEFMDNEGNVMFRSAKASVNTVQRSRILDMPASAYTPQYKAAFFESESFGLYANIGAGDNMEAYDFNEDDAQYAFKQNNGCRKVRVTSLPRRFYTEINTPVSMTLGESYPDDVYVEIGMSSDVWGSLNDTNFKVLQKTSDRVWLVNDNSMMGIIQRMED